MEKVISTKLKPSYSQEKICSLFQLPVHQKKVRSILFFCLSLVTVTMLLINDWGSSRADIFLCAFYVKSTFPQQKWLNTDVNVKLTEFCRGSTHSNYHRGKHLFYHRQNSREINLFIRELIWRVFPRFKNKIWSPFHDFLLSAFFFNELKVRIDSIFPL